MTKVEEARARFARFINADPGEIAIVSSASEGAYQVASSFAWNKRTDIVTSALEFPSVGHVLRAQQAQWARKSRWSPTVLRPWKLKPGTTRWTSQPRWFQPRW